MSQSRATGPVVIARPPVGSGNCPRCRRDDVTHRVIVGAYELRTCRLCADGFKREASARIEPLA